MRAIILSAGQGTRLKPWTDRTPKCLLPVEGARPVLELQLRTLAACGVRDALVVTGFGADQVDTFVRERSVEGIRVRTLCNPFFRAADNLVSAWLAVREMDEDFVLLNGDTLFQPEALERLLASPPAPVTLAVDEKRSYDADDMKVSLEGRRLRAVGKSIEERVDGESIGLMLFCGDGVRRFREMLGVCVRGPEGRDGYYLSAVDRLARSTRVETISIAGIWWQEIDEPADWAQARAALQSRELRLGTAGSATRREPPTRRRRSLQALLAVLFGVTFVAGPRAADADPVLPSFDPSVEGDLDPWLSGPMLKVYPIQGVVRPFLVGAVGRRSDLERLGIGDPTNRCQDPPLVARVGGGLELRVTEKSAVSVESSYIQPGGSVESGAGGTLGLSWKLRF